MSTTADPHADRIRLAQARIRRTLLEAAERDHAGDLTPDGGRTSRRAALAELGQRIADLEARVDEQQELAWEAVRTPAPDVEPRRPWLPYRDD